MPDTATERSVAPTSEPEQASQDVEADTAAAEAALLTVADLPEGWTEAEARTVLAFTVEPGVLACYEAADAEFATDALAGTAADGSSFGAPSATRLQNGPAGDATQAIRVTVPVTGDPAVAAVTADHVMVRSGRSLATITFASSAEATPVETIDSITAVVAERLVA